MKKFGGGVLLVLNALLAMIIIFAPSQILSLATTNVLYVDPSNVNACTIKVTDCGTSVKPFTTIGDAIAAAMQGSTSELSTNYNWVVLVNPVQSYVGTQNIGINVQLAKGSSIELRSMTATTVTIDCQGSGYFMNIRSTSHFKMNNFLVKNCNANIGGAMSIVQSSATLTNCNFLNNVASIGGAIYIDSCKSVIISATKFDSNQASERGAAFDVINSPTVELFNVEFANVDKTFSCRQSSVVADTIVSKTTATAMCDDQCSFSKGRTVICHRTFDNIIGDTPIESPFCLPSRNSAQCGTSCQSTTDSCLSCDACPCFMSGAFVTTAVGSCTKSRLVTPTINFDDLLSGFTDKVTIDIVAYVKVPKSGYYSYSTHSTHLGLSLQMDSRTMLISTYQRELWSSNRTIYLEQKHPHALSFRLTSPATFVALKRSFSFSFDNGQGIEMFYSRSICGDGIFHKDMTDCDHDKHIVPASGNIVCGDNICNEDNPNDCFQDCYSHITPICDARKVPKNHIAPGFITQDDTLGAIIDNQMIWHLPGSEHMTTAIDIVSGEHAQKPIFYFGYCSDSDINLVQDVYRGSVYELPKELAGKMLPQCSFDTSTTTHSSVTEMKESKTKKSMSSYSGSIGGSYDGVGAEVNAAYSKDQSITQTNSKSDSSTSTIFVTEIACNVSTVELVEIVFHPTFLKDVKKCKSVNDMVGVIEKYGTHYIKSGVLGGKLTQSTITSEVMTSSEQEADWSESSKRSMGASIKTPVLQGGASNSDTSDSTLSGKQQDEKMAKSERTSIVTLGGSPGSYAPGSSSQGEMFQKWASSIDLNPAVISQDLYPIRDIIPSTWMTSVVGKNVQSLWKDAETIYYDRNSFTENPGRQEFQYMLLMHTASSTTKFLPPTITIKWTDVKNKPKESKIDLYYQRRDEEDTLSPPYMMDFNYVVPATESAKDTCWNIETNFGHEKIADTYQRYCQYSRKSILSPLRFDFVLDADFLTSTTRPVITVTGIPSTMDPAFSIVRFESSEGIVFDKNGGYKPFATTYVTTAIHHLFGPSVENAVTFQLTKYATGTKTYLRNVISDLYTPQEYSTITDRLYIKYTNPSGTETALGHHSFNWEVNKEQKFVYGYFSHPYTTGTPTYRYSIQYQIGSTTRVDWALSMEPQPSISSWKRKALYHHTAMNHYQSLPPLSLTTSHLNMKMEPMDPTRFDWLYTRNYVSESVNGPAI
ncbi:hypothetical protein DFA_10518 [Cavenderia fasciculata]|uniref:MACPF domain-containing protein n=1 Tax=Cavenderia fasciculata TaxID=261658 RepID=F4QAF7_CACFS|nr:uncharacterized protein DFA_10518 [Cavenderia fasciculata]EGG15676.1 hypothetical protein DFA_10518 [Cavenderia fasciculata]|eukprot:XP_004354418.1 hypothetical protein DFA_10518 [Cavenderia fasciculata]